MKLKKGAGKGLVRNTIRKATRYPVLVLTATLSAGLSSLSAQEARYVLRGFMGIQGGESFTYRLDLKDSAAGFMSGYAYTYLNEKNDVKARIVAEIDRNAKTLRVTETDILHNNYFVSKATICLVDSRMQFSPGERVLTGPLSTSTMGNGASCSRGSISFSNMEEINQLFNGNSTATKNMENPAAPKPTADKPAVKPRRIVMDTAKVAANPPARQEPAVASITEGKDKTYTWESDQIIIELWDGNTVDNDRITVLFNGTEVLSNYSLVKDPRKLTLPTGGNELNIISIIANNEGGDPPNTANILLRDGEKSYDVLAHNKTGKQALIRIRKKLR